MGILDQDNLTSLHKNQKEVSDNFFLYTLVFYFDFFAITKYEPPK